MQKYRLNLLGLGDVGSTLSIGLKVLGGDILSEIRIIDLDEHRMNRWEMELNQIVVNPDLKIIKGEMDSIFDCDIFVFCASKFVPEVGKEAGDVRMIQFDANKMIVRHYIEKAIESGFKGYFAIVSDPVDLLCIDGYHHSQKYSQDKNLKALLSNQIRGFGLGVMDGRAKYYSDKSGFNYRKEGRVFGPHGKDLLVIEDMKSFSKEKSERLNHLVIEANLRVRDEGFKPYVAPALSSGSNAILDFLRNKWHYSAHFDGEIFFGEWNKVDEVGLTEREDCSNTDIKMLIDDTKERLKKTWETLK